MDITILMVGIVGGCFFFGFTILDILETPDTPFSVLGITLLRFQPGATHQSCVVIFQGRGQGMEVLKSPWKHEEKF